MNQRYALYFLLSFFLLAVPACGVVRTTGKVVKTAGKVGWETAKITGKVAKTTGRAAWVTGKAAGRGVRGVVYMARGRQIIRLEKDGNSFYVYVKVNKKAVGRFLVDTGASDMQISQAMAKRLKINLNKGERVMATVAGGGVVAGRAVDLNEVSLGRVRVRHVRAIVLDYDRMGKSDGLLGMSFFNHFVFQIDTKKSELILQQRVD